MALAASGVLPYGERSIPWRRSAYFCAAALRCVEEPRLAVLLDIMIPISRPHVGEDDRAAVLRVMDSGMLVQGPETAALEREFASVTGTAHAVATSSGTTALHLALLANGIGPGDEVITTSFTFIASANSILYTGARPVFVDIDPATFNIDPRLIGAAITPRTRAIMPVHLYGLPCDLEPILRIAREQSLAVIEDSAQAIGASYRGQHVGSFGTGAFSLYATKNVMSAEGGIVTTNDAAIAERVRMLRNHGMQRRYFHEMLGFNARMTDIQAAIGRVQLGRLESYQKARSENADYLSRHIRSVRTPQATPGSTHAWHQYTVRVPEGMDRDGAVQRLAELGIGTGIFYPVPAHLQGYMREAAGSFSLPATEAAASEVFSLPVHPDLSPLDLEVIVNGVNQL